MRLGLGLGKTVLVWSVAVLMAVNPASACRWRCWSYCQPSYSSCAPSACYSPCYSACDTSCSSSCVTYPADDCPICKAAEGSAPVTTNKVPDEAPSTAPPTFEPMPAPSEPMPAPSEPATEPPSLEPAPAPAPEPFAPSEPAPEPEPFPSTEPAPAPTPSEPSPTTPAAPAPGGIDDLFSEPAETPADAPSEMPAEPAAPGGAVDDLFDTPAEPSTPDEPAAPSGADDLFQDLDDKGAAAPQEGSSDENLDDLFSEPEEPAPMSTRNDELKALENEAERLFAAGPAGEGQGDGMRLWTDNTGKYQVRARLAVVGRTHVRLLKENGKYTTVPYGRLSQQDLAFVRQHAEHVVAAAY